MKPSKMRILLPALIAAVLMPAVTSIAGAQTGGGQTGGGQTGGAAGGPDNIVIVGLPGITWEDIDAVGTPVLDGLIDDGAVATMSVRTAIRHTTPIRGYLTLGAGNRAFAPAEDDHGYLALPADTPYENGTAAEAVARRFHTSRDGEIVHPELPYLIRRTAGPEFGTRLGALGEALAEADVPRAVVVASDLAVSPTGTAAVKRAAVLGLVDRAGTVDTGTIGGLVRPAPGAPYGVETDPDLFSDAVRDALEHARVVLVDPGETFRADEYALNVTPEQATVQREDALAKADGLLGRVVDQLGPGDRLYVVSPSRPRVAPADRLTAMVAYGSGIEEGWLTSPTTRRAGIVALTDLAPSVLRALELDVPTSMTGTPIHVEPARAVDRVARMVALDQDSLIREQLFTPHTSVYIALIILLAVLAFATFISSVRVQIPRNLALRLLPVVALAVLAYSPASVIIRAVGAHSLGVAGAMAVLVAVTALLVAVALRVPGPRWAGGVGLLLLTLAIAVADVVSGSPLQVNGTLGYSPIVAGRFYGVGAMGLAILVAAGILGLMGLADLRGHQRVPWWAAAGLFALIPLIGLPQLGANFGGILGAVPGVVVAYALGRHLRLRWRTLLVGGAAGGLLALGALLVDAARPPEVQTHLGRFATRVMEGGVPELMTVLERKAAANIGLLGTTVWAYTVPVGLAVLILLLWRPHGVLRDVIPNRPLLRAGLAGSLAGGLALFITNDSGIAIPAMVLAHVVPLFALMGVETLAPGAQDRQEAPGAKDQQDSAGAEPDDAGPTDSTQAAVVDAPTTPEPAQGPAGETFPRP